MIKLKPFLLKNGREYKCECCENPGIWQGKELRLQVDHIDGNRENNGLENLRFLCPNCHTQTDTYCGKNTKRSKFSDWKVIGEDEFINVIVNSKNVSLVLSSLKLNTLNSLARNHVKHLMVKHDLKFKDDPTFLISEKIKEIENSGIDFSKFGWVGKVAKILSIEPQKVGGWMNRNMTVFYHERCYRRKLMP